MMKTEVTSRELAKLLALTSTAIVDLAKREILVSGSKRDSYKLQESIRNYVEHLRQAAGQGSEDTVKLAAIERKESLAPKADLAKTKAERMPGDTVLASDLGKPEITKLRSLRNRLLGVDNNRRYLAPYAHVRLMTKRVRSFRIYIGDGRCYTVWDN
jgi:phage terminase Nu1 subunit (DNA packaging protein)